MYLIVGFPLFFSLILGLSCASAQSYTISGYVRDKATGEILISANIYAPLSGQGTNTNTYGYYSLKLKGDSVLLEFSFVGYEKHKIKILLQHDTRLDIELNSDNVLDVVAITTEEEALSSPQLSVHKLDHQIIKKSAVLLGEADLLKSLQLLPGVQAGNEGFATINVRGGSSDQNLILMDGIPVYNVNHLFGFLSTFNPEVIHDVTFIKGGIPARYGERLSSVVDVSLREGNSKEFEGSFTLSPITGQLTVEGPVLKKRSSILVSARRTWFDGIINLASPGNPIKYNFNDLNIKYNHTVNENNKFFLGFHTAKDKFFSDLNTRNSAYQFKWGNATYYFRWNKILGPRLFASFTAYSSGFNFLQGTRVTNNAVQQIRSVKSVIGDNAVNIDFDYYHTSSHHFRFGTQTSYLMFKPEVSEYIGYDEPINPASQKKDTGWNYSLYFEDEIKITDKLSLNAGIRESIYFLRDRKYFYLQPRINVSYVAFRNTAVKLSYNRMVQFLHLLTNTAISFPVDLWVPSTTTTKPEIAHQFTLGLVQKNLNKIDISVETYYKKMYNLIEYKDGANYLFGSANNWEEKIGYGEGVSYGLEFFVEKKSGSVTGWASYTLSRTERQFEEINDGKYFPFKYDKRHNLSVLSSYNFTKNKALSVIFVLTSGSLITFPEGVNQGTLPPNYRLTERFRSGGYTSDFYSQNIISRRNNYSLPLYHRLDLNYQTSRITKNGNKRSWIFSVYNLYNRQNPFLLYSEEGIVKQFTLFPIIPSVGYKLEF